VTKYALDTDTLSYYLKGNQSIIDRISNETDYGNFMIIPPMVFFEVKRWLLAVNSTKKLAIFETMCSLSGIGFIDRDILEAASVMFSDLRKKGITIGDNDILISAYCLHHDFTLITNNEKHFRRIPGLKIENWLQP